MRLRVAGMRKGPGGDALRKFNDVKILIIQEFRKSVAFFLVKIVPITSWQSHLVLIRVRFQFIQCYCHYKAKLIVEKRSEKRSLNSAFSV